ncbi:MAG TPA: adenylate/guanylate cyclase domain-containing protein [Candidatus Didemnitutus sp.]|nr:adenylate/guanylate cyclase domain-containing protein [Candidatus Didemnitutus sp.]
MEASAISSILRPGQRALAAIVFTDVVSFSARMQDGEERTLKLLERDFATMREFCRQHDGAVLKTTGDGLLMYFSSAVQAVACALTIQRHFADWTKNRPANEVLSHRVGIHLGDVFVSEQDVMGDGVNIAARLQAEARPGGICISQTVYDVVKNKLELHVTSLGPRELKNMAESIHVYRLLLDAQSLRAAQTAEMAERVSDAMRSVTPGLGKFKTWWLRPAVRLTSVVVLIALPIAALAWLWHAHALASRQSAEADTVRAAIAAIIANPPANANRDVEELNRAVAEDSRPARRIRSDFLDSYNFAALVRFLRAPPIEGGPLKPLPALQKSAEQMAAAKGWMIAELQGYTQEQPLRIYELSGTAPKELHVFTEIDRRLYFVWGGAVLARDWSDVKPAWVAAVLVGTMRNAHTPPDPQVVNGALAFARIYGENEIASALISRHPHVPPR